MMNKTLALMATFALTTQVMAGGDDRDTGPVEPIFDKVVVKSPAAKTLILTPEPMLIDKATQKVVKTPTGKSITVKAHQACKDRLGLSTTNIERFKAALAGNYLYSTGPIDEIGTEFAPARWDDYLTCIERQ